MTTNQIVRVIPVLKVNNRNVNQDFYEETLGMKVLVEEGALLSLGDASNVEKIVLEESPTALYQGANGRAFEVVSPQGDRILVHAEEELESLEPLEEAPLVVVPDDFTGLTAFEVAFLEVNVPDPAQAKKLYETADLTGFVHVKEAQGEDLQLENNVTWDLSTIKVELAAFDVEALRESLGAAVEFVHRKGSFMIAKDTSRIELWFEGKQGRVHISYEP